MRVELDEGGPAERLLGRIGLDLGSEARELAKELEERRLAVSRDENVVYVYAPYLRDAEQARRVIEAELADERLVPRSMRVEHWLHDEDRWDSEPPAPDYEEEMLARGHAPWEVRVECETHREARELADSLEAEGYGVIRRWRYLLVGAASREEAQALAERLHGEAEPSTEAVWEVLPQNPFAVFGGLGGTGTPL